MILSHISVTYFPLEILGHSPLTLCSFVTMHLGHYFIISRVSEAVQFFRRWRHHPSFGRLVVGAWLPTFLELSNNRQLSVLLIIIQIFIYSALSMMTLFFLCLYWHSLMDAWMLSVEGAVGVRGVIAYHAVFVVFSWFGQTLHPLPSIVYEPSWSSLEWICFSSYSNLVTWIH